MADSDHIAIAPIPLHCTLCPKRPRFSDLSHLLTHVASKGHLSHLFKVTVRTSSDEASQVQLDEYNRWYEQHGIERLLSTRMLKREGRDEKSGKNKKKKQAEPSRSRSKKTDVFGSFAQSPLPIETSQQAINLTLSDERRDYGFDYSHPAEDTQLQTGAQHRAHIPRMHLWHTIIDTDYPSPTLDRHLEGHGLGSSSSELVDHSAATAGNSFDPFLDYHFDSASDSGPPSTFIADCSDVFDPYDCGAEAQLKGVCWPGMDIFDAATPEMRRKRNQKKDGTILAQLKLSSAQVEPMEQVYGSNGDLQKERPISRLLEESPLKKERPPPKKRQPRSKRPALSEASNSHLNRRSTGPRQMLFKDGTMNTSSIKKTSRRSRRSRALVSPITQGALRHYLPTTDENEEFRMSIRDLGKRKRPGVVVYRDVDDEANDAGRKSPTTLKAASHISFRENSERLNFPQEFAHLNSEFLIDPQFDALTSHSLAANSDRSRNTDYPNGNGARSVGKENVEPIFDAAGRIDAGLGKSGKEKRPPRETSACRDLDSISYEYGSQRMEDRPSSGLYNLSSNPLAYSFQQQSGSYEETAISQSTYDDLHYLTKFINQDMSSQDPMDHHTEDNLVEDTKMFDSDH